MLIIGSFIVVSFLVIVGLIVAMIVPKNPTIAAMDNGY
jgi:purine-cytosine permease-like protein